MLQDRRYVGTDAITNATIKPFSVGALSTPNSPSHISVAANYLNMISSPTNANSYHIQATLPQSVISKPISVTILPSARQATQIQHTSTRIVSEPVHNLRAIGANSGQNSIGGSASIQQIHQVQQIQHGYLPYPSASTQVHQSQSNVKSQINNQGQLYKRITMQQQQQQSIISHRYNNRFYGSGVPDNSKSRSRSISPIDGSRSIGISGVVQQVEGQQVSLNRQSRSSSPVVVSTGLSQSQQPPQQRYSGSPAKNQINFMYASQGASQGQNYMNQTSQHSQQSVVHQQNLQQPQIGSPQMHVSPAPLPSPPLPPRQLSPQPITHPVGLPTAQVRPQVQFNTQYGQYNQSMQQGQFQASFNQTQQGISQGQTQAQYQEAEQTQQGQQAKQSQAGQILSGQTAAQTGQSSQLGQVGSNTQDVQQGQNRQTLQAPQTQAQTQGQSQSQGQSQGQEQTNINKVIDQNQQFNQNQQIFQNQFPDQAQRVQFVQQGSGQQVGAQQVGGQGQQIQQPQQGQLTQEQMQRQPQMQISGQQYFLNLQYPQYAQYPQQPNVSYHQHEATRMVQPMVPIAPPPSIQGIHPHGMVHPHMYHFQNAYDPNSNQMMHIDNRTLITTTTIIWEHRFIEIYSKFEIFVQRFQAIVDEIYYIDDLFENVSDEEAWNDLRTKYSDMIDKFNQMREEIILVLEQNKAAVNSLSPEVIQELEQKQMIEQEKEERQEEQRQEEQEGDQRNRHQQEQQHQGRGEEGGQTGKSGSDNNHIWQNRYLELMQQHEQLAQENGELGHEVEKLRAMVQQMQDHIEAEAGGADQRKPRSSEHENIKVIELQRNLNTVHSQYQKLQDNYTKLSDQYSKVVSELQNIGSGEHEGTQNELSELHQQLQMAEAKIRQLYEQGQTKDEHIGSMQKQMQQYAHIFEENKHLNQTIKQMQISLQSYDAELKNKDKVLEEFDSENKSLHEQFTKLSKSLQQFQGHNNQNPQVKQDQDKRTKQLQILRKQLQHLKEQQKNLLNVVEKHEQSIQQMGNKYQELSREYEGTVKQKEDQINLLNKFLDEQRQAKEKAIRQNVTVEPTKAQSIAQSKIFKQRLQIQIEEIIAEKNRKIKSLTQDLDDLKSRIETIEKDKQKSIKQIKDYFQQEEEKYIKKIQDKDSNLKLVNQKIRSFEHQLSNRNLQISRFRHRSPVNSFSSANEESKKHSEALEKKNYEMQQLRRSIQQKSINIKQLEQKVFSLQQQINGKVFQINSLKRQTYDSHGHKAELDNLNNVIKKKNQQLNELRLTGLELDQLKLSMDSLERQKIRLNEYLKQKTRQCESKDATIQSLQRKVTSMSFQNIGASRKRSIDSDRNATAVSLSNYETLLRQRQNELKNAKYELDMLETKTQINQKTIRDLNNRINSTQRSASVLKAEMQNKIGKYQNQIKQLSKQIRNLKANKQQLANIIESFQSKNHSLEKSLDQRNSLFDKEVSIGKNKLSEFEKYNTSLLTDKQILKNENDRLMKDNKQLNDRIVDLQGKIQSKNIVIDEIKGNYQKKQKQGTKVYEQKIKKLDGDLKLSSVRLKKMEQQIQILNKKIASAQSQKRSYRQRLITEHNSNDKQEFIDFRFASEHYDDHQDHIEFRLKDPQSNDVFERKVIYDLKKENDLLKKQLSGMGGYNSFSMNRIDTHHNRFSNHEQEAFTERDRFRQGKFDDSHNDQLLTYHKNKNKQLEARIDQLLKVNNELKQRISILNAGANNQMSIQFYKDQVARLQADVAKLQARMKQMLSEHESTRDQIAGHEHMVENIKDKVSEQQSKISQLKNIIRQKQEVIAHLENTKSICQQEIERLKQMLEKGQKDKDQISRRDKSLNQSSKKQRSLQQQVAKLTNKNSIQAAEIERLNQVLKIKKNELDNRYGQSNQQARKLKKRILDLQKQLQLLKLEHSSQISSSGDLEYKLELIRSFFVNIEVLIGQLPLQDRRAQTVTQQVRSHVKEGLNAVASISV